MEESKRTITCACGRPILGNLTRTREETEEGRVHWIVRVDGKFHHICDWA
jgi:hypothetical protein